LILSGPTGTDRGDYKIWYLPTPIASSQLAPLTSVTTTTKPKNPTEQPKAESITVINQTADKITVVMSYDNIDEGAPTTYELQLSQ
jgi:hypothetical protein